MLKYLKEHLQIYYKNKEDKLLKKLLNKILYKGENMDYLEILKSSLEKK